ncbi:GntR family transcriptional regulator [Spongiactinospora rosea]|uniref:GntR family transcriptional regulator n=1 Tax=Spongiactinospora rosea TaxID=2248750 RepID=A0A366LQI6_9ACTN|nr:GntR family transcriptional regulator [Spongiactinospora rosea]RBQ16148.1 GntR family transcriptional regulator [Spongiactinospora rosea]
MIEHLSLPDTVRLALRRKILNNELPAGTRLVEAGIADDYGVSRATVRQALRDLQNEGLVDISPRRYTMVTRMSPEDIHDICYARCVLETAAARDALARLPDGFFARLERIIEEMAAAAEAGDILELVDIDTRFHHEIVRASGRRRLGDLWSTMNGHMYALMRSSLDRRHLAMPEAVARHRHVIDALAGGDLKLIETVIHDHYLQPVLPEEPS